MKRLLITLAIMGLLLVAQLRAMDIEPLTVFVGPYTVECIGVGPQSCLLVKRNETEGYTLHYSGVEGFDELYQPGFEYELWVDIQPVENPPADATSEHWKLIEILSKTRVLEGNIWQLQSLVSDGTETLANENATVTINFKEGAFGGNASCNQYGGDYTLDGASLIPGNTFSTMMACLDDALMQQESAYLNALTTVSGYTIDNDVLQLLDADGNAVLIYTVREPRPLIGTQWIATAYNDGSAVVSIVGDTLITAHFTAVNHLSGSAGCNTYMGDFSTTLGSLSIGPQATTRMACAEDIMQQENAYLAALERAFYYTIEGDVLQLRDAEGATLATYRAADVADQITGLMLLWENYTTANGETETVPNPENYTLQFNADGSYYVQADCNQGSGQYTLSGNALDIAPGPITLAACAPESLSSFYLDHLANVSQVTLENGQVILQPGIDGAVLTFSVAE